LPVGGTTWSPGEAWSFAFAMVTKRFVPVIVPMIVGFLAMMLPSIIVSVIVQVASGVIVDILDESVAAFAAMGFNLILQVISYVVQMFILGGMAATAIKAVRGQPVSYGDVFSGGRYFGAMLVSSILVGIATTLGALLCIVPGVILYLGLGLYSFAVVDEGLSGVDSVKRSWELTQGHKLNLFLFWLISILVAIAGALACGVGLLVVGPALFIGQAYIFARLKGEQPTTPA
jgi:uncharacterized membrane protein